MENENIRVDVKWRLVRLPLFLSAITPTAFFFLPRGKGYFQRMKIDFPLDLRIIKEHNNESRFPPADF